MSDKIVDVQVHPTEPEQPKEQPAEFAEQRQLQAEMRTIKHLIKCLQRALTATELGEAQPFFTVDVNDDGAPVIGEHKTIEAVAAHMMHRRLQQADAAEGETLYTLIFQGIRWKVRKGREWFLCCGEKAIPLEGSVPEFDDGSGSLFEAPEPPEPAPGEETEEAEEEDSEEEQPTSESEEEPDEDEVAAPGETPQVFDSIVPQQSPPAE